MSSPADPATSRISGPTKALLKGVGVGAGGVEPPSSSVSVIITAGK
jgi:hypothetical protein